MKVKIDRFKTRDISDTPEGFEKRYADKRPKEKPRSPMAEPNRPNMSKLLERFGINDERP